MMRCSVKNPRWSTPHATRKSVHATSVAAKAKPVSAGRDQLALRDGMRRNSLHARTAGGQDDEGDEREEPRDVEVEPVGQGQLEADQDGRGEGRELERRLAPRDEVAGDRPHHEQQDRDLLERAEVGNAGSVVLAPAPDRERRVAPDLPAEGAVPEDTGRVGRARLEEQDRERGSRRDRKTACKRKLSGESAALRISRPKRRKQ